MGPMKSKEEILKRLHDCKMKLAIRYKIAKIGLFGSYARGDQTDDSDVDVFVDVDASIGLEFVSLAEEIEKDIGLPVDVISSRAIHPRYRQSIEAELIYV